MRGKMLAETDRRKSLYKIKVYSIMNCIDDKKIYANILCAATWYIIEGFISEKFSTG